MSINSTSFRMFAFFALVTLVCVLMSCSSKKTKPKTIAPTITSTAPTTAAVGISYSYSITGTGTPIPSLSVSGLPGWLLFDGIDLISGTPVAGDIGTTGTITVTATNGTAPDAIQTFNVVVALPVAPAITSVAPTTATVGTLYSYTVTTTGNPAPTVSVSGLPSWLSYNNGTQTVSGTPAAGNAGMTGTITVTSSNGVLPEATQTFTIDVYIAPTITSTATTTAGVGRLYSYSITATGNPVPSLSVTGLPSWLSYNSGTQTISGTPAAGDIGTTGTITVSASNGIIPNAVQAFVITVEVWVDVSGSVIVSGELSSINGGVLRLMDGMTVEASCEITSGMYALTVKPGNYAYNITYPNYFLTVTTPVGGNISVGTTDIAQDVHIVTTSIGYFKASNTGVNDEFGWSVAISGDTMVVGANFEHSNATGINGDQSNDSAENSGAAYIFVRTGSIWSQQAYLKASNTDASDVFGCSVAISGDTIVVGAYHEASNATGINGDQLNNSAENSGAAYVFVRTGSIWTQQAYLKASNNGTWDKFGYSVAISGDTIVVGAHGEGSNATGINGNQSDNSASLSGAVYVFIRNAGVWSQQAYLKASNTNAGDVFGGSVAISGDTIVVEACGEDSYATGINGNQSDNSAIESGAVYVFVRNAGVWSQQAYLKASNTDSEDQFGSHVAISGNTIIVGARYEDSNATGINGNQSNNSASNSGAAYVFVRNTSVWSQQAYLKASNTEANDVFGWSVAISGDTIVVGARDEESNASGINGDQFNNYAGNSGAAYVYVRNAGVWTQQTYLKASNTGSGDCFGCSVAISGDMIVVGAYSEDSYATGINGSQSDNSASYSGAAYMYQNP
ncbi:MAG: putative Ig domain-containing protein [Planctomycetota bacterium]